MNYARFINKSNGVRIHDDLIRYIADSLSWISTLNPATGKIGAGLNFYGPTAILSEGASVAQRIFCAWAELFSLGPSELELTGGWSQVEGEPMESGRHEKLIFSRDMIVANLITLADYANQVSLSPKEFYVLHLGI
jgi:hypothetical protein